MLSLETRVNGVLIGLVNVKNEMISDGKKNYLYGVEAYGLGEDKYNFNFEIRHNRSDGAEKLLLKIYEKIDKIKRKMK